MTEPSWIRDGESDRTLEENWLFRLRRERYRSRASGRSHDFYVLHLADAVHVVALTTDRQLILVRQFRAGSGRDSLETPGGLLEPGEDAREAGSRELLEETGYAGDPPLVLGAMWSDPVHPVLEDHDGRGDERPARGRNPPRPRRGGRGRARPRPARSPR